MTRVLLILCYLLSVLVGPRACCCAAPSPAPPILAKATPTKGCPRCAAAGKADTPSKADQPRPAKQPNCPCPKTAVSAPAVPPADDTRPHVAAGDTLAAVSPVVPIPAHAVHTAVVGPPPDPSAHLLHLCHRLRC